MNTIELSIPAHLDHIDLVRICLFGVATKLGFSYEEIEDMKVAVAEACSNAVLHGCSHADQKIAVTFQHNDDSLAISICNEGQSFDYAVASVVSASLGAIEPTEGKACGLGLYLMEALMDKVEVHATKNGTDVCLTKYRTLAASV